MTDQSATDRLAVEQTAREQTATGQTATGQTATDQAATGQPAKDQTATGQPATGQAATNTVPTSEASADERGPAFGEKTPSRFAADVEYSGSSGRHDYLVRVRHRLLDTTFTVVIDGIEHDPKAEVKARPPEEGAEGEPRTTHGAGEGPVLDGDGGPVPDSDGGPVLDGDGGPVLDRDEDPASGGGEDSAADEVSSPESGADPEPWAADDLRFTVKDGFATQLCTVRRPKDGGGYVNAEDITVRTVGLGGAGEVEIRHGFKRTVLVPADDSPSAAREEKRAAHPTRYALVAAIMKSARYLLPLLGLGALFSGVLDPLLEWIEARVRPAVDAIARIADPVREWVAQLLRPIQEFLDAVFSPIRGFFAMLLRPVRDLLAWLLGLLPDISLPFDIPDWLPDLLVPAIVVVTVFVATRKGLHNRAEKLAAAKAAKAAGAGGPGHAAPGDGGKEQGSSASGEGAGVQSPPSDASDASDTSVAPEALDPEIGDHSSTDPLRPLR